MTKSGAITKPKVFISHAATDEQIAEIICNEISRIFANGVETFVSSVPGTIEPGGDWLKSINKNLAGANVVIVLITPVSINRPWIWFEVGASWSRAENGDGRIIPICVAEIEKGKLPEPLSRLHALSLGKAAETKELFQTLIDHFGFGLIKGFRYASIKSRIPKYESLSIAEQDVRSGMLYDGPYSGYSNAELEEVLEDEFLGPEFVRLRDSHDVQWGKGWKLVGQYVFSGSLVHFRQVDEDLRLPPGTAKKLLVKVLKRNYEVEIEQQTDNTIRFSDPVLV